MLGVLVAIGIPWLGVSFGVILKSGIEGVAEVFFIECAVVLGGSRLAAYVAFSIFRLGIRFLPFVQRLITLLQLVYLSLKNHHIL